MKNKSDELNLLDKEDSDKYQIFMKIKDKISKGEKEFIFENGKVNKAGDNFIYQLEEETMFFFINSKIIFFKKEKSNAPKAYFIYDETSFKNALEKEKIENGILKRAENTQKEEKNPDSDNSNKSNSSDISINSLDVEDILKSSSNIIEESKSIKITKIFSDNNFNKRFKSSKISDLDFNFKYINEDFISNNIDYLESQNNWYKQLREFYRNNEKSYCFLFGPKGTGKTTTVLKYLNIEKIPRLYFPLKIMLRPDFSNKNWEKISFRETLYTFSDKDEMKLFSEYDMKKISGSSNIMEFIFSYIKFVIEFYSEKKIKKKKIFIVLDDYNEIYDHYNLIEQIIDYTNQNNDKICLCIAGQGKFINSKLYQYLSNKNYDFLGIYCNLLLNNENTKANQLLQLPKYYYKYNDLKSKSNNIKEKKHEDNHTKKEIVGQNLNNEINGNNNEEKKESDSEISDNNTGKITKNKFIKDVHDNNNIEKEVDKRVPKKQVNNNSTNKELNENNIKNEIIKEFKNNNLHSFLILSKYIGASINIEELKDVFILIPFEYLSIEIKKDNIRNIIMIKFFFNLEIYKIIFNESIKGLLKIDTLKNKKNLFKDESNGKDGIDFEDLIIEQFWNNTFDYIQFPENNKLIVTEIYELKNNIVVNKNLTISKPIIIKQTKFQGKFYDLLIIINKDDKRCAIFIQIGLDKTGIEINRYLSNLIKNENSYIRGIELFINDKINSLGFMLILDHDHQKDYLNNTNIKSKGVGYCINNNIDFLIYKEFNLYKNLEDTNPINSIEITDRTLLYSIENEQSYYNIELIKEKFIDICNDISLLEKDNTNDLNLTKKEKEYILQFIKSKYQKDYDELKFIINVCENQEGFNNFGIIDYKNFGQINIFINKNSKYFSYNNEVFLITKKGIKEIDKTIYKDDKYRWDLYFLKKKRKNT